MVDLYNVLYLTFHLDGVYVIALEREIGELQDEVVLRVILLLNRNGDTILKSE
jgi:hypothetical protein